MWAGPLLWQRLKWRDSNVSEVKGFKCLLKNSKVTCEDIQTWMDGLMSVGKFNHTSSKVLKTLDYQRTINVDWQIYSQSPKVLKTFMSIGIFFHRLMSVNVWMSVGKFNHISSKLLITLDYSRTRSPRSKDRTWNKPTQPNVCWQI